jgi:hypothetical protein
MQSTRHEMSTIKRKLTRIKKSSNKRSSEENIGCHKQVKIVTEQFCQ